jgi:hypothetical protein
MESTREDLHEFDVLLLHRRVPVVLDGVVSTTGQHLGHLSPFAAVGGVRQKQNPFLMEHPLYFEDVGVKVVMPSFAALLAESAFYKLGNEGPSLRPVLLN